MAVKNGAQFVKEQIDSIIPQLGENDELIISDDHSTDDTCLIIRSYNDPRIRLISNPHSGIISNFENSLLLSRGEFIFLCDQDDVWVSNKVSLSLQHLVNYDLVISDCLIISQQHQKKKGSFFELNHSGKGLVKNLIRNSYMGCCMAFHRKVLEKAIPFPKKIPMHDLWIGLIGELYFNVAFIPDKLVYHRRHSNNASSSSEKSPYSLLQKINFRYKVVKNLIRLSYV